MPTWPHLDASLDCDAGWRQRFGEADRLGRYRPVARPVFHSVAGAVFGADGALARLASGAAVAVYLQADGIGLVLARADDTTGGDHDGAVMAVVLPPGSPRPVTPADLAAALAGAPRQRIEPDPRAWPATAACY